MEFQHTFIGSANAAATLLNRAKVIDNSKISVRIEVDNFYSAIRLVSAERGICVAPSVAAAKLADFLHIAVIPLADAWASRRYVIVFRNENAVTPAARLLVGIWRRQRLKPPHELLETQEPLLAHVEGRSLIRHSVGHRRPSRH